MEIAQKIIVLIRPIYRSGLCKYGQFIEVALLIELYLLKNKSIVHNEHTLRSTP